MGGMDLLATLKAKGDEATVIEPDMPLLETLLVLYRTRRSVMGSKLLHTFYHPLHQGHQGLPSFFILYTGCNKSFGAKVQQDRQKIRSQY